MKKRGRLVLASQSPRRQELLKDAGIEFVTMPVHIEEVVEPLWTPEQCARNLAFRKACAVISQLDLEDDCSVLSADTVVALGNEIFGKPKDRREGYEMLRLLSHNPHRVITAVCLWDMRHRAYAVEHETTGVEMNPMSHGELQEYVDSGDGMDKAGGYGIQSFGDRRVRSIAGNFDNVVGLPMSLVKKMLNAWA